MTAERQESDDEFYIGYDNRMPEGIRRRVRAAVIAFGCAAAMTAATVVAASAALSPSRFEFGSVSQMSGVLRRAPYPVLDGANRRVWLVGPGKSGADRVLAGIGDGPVTLRGSRIQRGRHEMLEVRSAEPASDLRSIEGNRGTQGQVEKAASVTLRGEIVDSKCFLGVMNPAEGAVHRDCARRCLSGGIPPMLLVRDGKHREELVLLVSDDGSAIGTEIRQAAGRPLEVTGRLVRDGNDYVLYVTGYTPWP